MNIFNLLGKDFTKLIERLLIMDETVLKGLSPITNNMCKTTVSKEQVSRTPGLTINRRKNINRDYSIKDLEKT